MKTKRIITIILALLCLTTLLTACQNSDVVTTEKEDTTKLYTDAKTSTESLKQLETVKTVKRIFSGDGGDFSDETVTNVKRTTNKNNQPLYLKSFEKSLVTEDGTESVSKSSLYCIDSMMYEMGTDGKKIAYMAKDPVIRESFKNVIPTIPTEALSNSTVYEGSETKQVVANANATSVHSLLHSFIGGINEYYSPVAGNDSFVFEYSTISINFDISGEYFKQIVIKFDASFCHKEGNAKVATVVTWDIISPGSDVTVEQPEDLKEYVILNESSEGNVSTDLFAAVDQLFGEMGETLPEYDTMYETLCEQYGKEAVDLAIEEYNKQHKGI